MTQSFQSVEDPPCRSWLASESGLKPYTAHEDAFAGKPGSYGEGGFKP